jgi:hypothetical protein
MLQAPRLRLVTHLEVAGRVFGEQVRERQRLAGRPIGHAAVEDRAVADRHLEAFGLTLSGRLAVDDVPE